MNKCQGPDSTKKSHPKPLGLDIALEQEANLPLVSFISLLVLFFQFIGQLLVWAVELSWGKTIQAMCPDSFTYSHSCPMGDLPGGSR